MECINILTLTDWFNFYVSIKNLIKISEQIYLLGHGGSEHVLDFIDFPVHPDPPFLAVVTIERFCILLPEPHVAEHFPLSNQGPHLQSTVLN